MPAPICLEPKAALEHMEKKGADLLIVDYNLGNANGIQFIARVRNLSAPAVASIPIIMLTAHTEYHRVLAAKEAGFDTFVRRPASNRELYEKINFVLAEKPNAFANTGSNQVQRKI